MKDPIKTHSDGPLTVFCLIKRQCKRRVDGFLCYGTFWQAIIIFKYRTTTRNIWLKEKGINVAQRDMNCYHTYLPELKKQMEEVKFERYQRQREKRFFFKPNNVFDRIKRPFFFRKISQKYFLGHTRRFSWYISRRQRFISIPKTTTICTLIVSTLLWY